MTVYLQFPAGENAELKRLGVAGVVVPGSPTTSIVQCIERSVAVR
jgi:hypothetical protein